LDFHYQLSAETFTRRRFIPSTS